MKKSSRRKFIALIITAIIMANIPYITFAADKPVLIFLHTPKAAGVSLNYNIVMNTDGSKMQLLYTPPYEIPVNKEKENKFWAKSQEKLDKYKYILGHINYGVHKHFSGKSEYISILRHPVARISSAYRYYEFDKKMSVEEFLNKGFAEADNGMVRRISGVGQSTPIGSITQETLQIAIDNIEKNFALIGTVEEYNKFIFLLGKKYGWSMNPSIRENITTSHPNHTSLLTKSDKAAIIAHNKYDLKLYDYVTKRFNKQFSALPEEEKSIKFQKFLTTHQSLEHVAHP